MTNYKIEYYQASGMDYIFRGSEDFTGTITQAKRHATIKSHKTKTYAVKISKDDKVIARRRNSDKKWTTKSDNYYYQF